MQQQLSFTEREQQIAVMQGMPARVVAARVGATIEEVCETWQRFKREGRPPMGVSAPPCDCTPGAASPRTHVPAHAPGCPYGAKEATMEPVKVVLSHGDTQLELGPFAQGVVVFAGGIVDVGTSRTIARQGADCWQAHEDYSDDVQFYSQAFIQAAPA